MRKLLMTAALVSASLFQNSACAYGRGAALTGVSAEAPPAQGQAANETQKFIPVEGADLRARMEAARARARADARTPYWTAYTFDVRPGVAVDPGGGEFHGMMTSSGDTHVFIGTTNGVTAETRNLGVFVLRDAAGAEPTRMEIYNLARRREYSGYPVYWAARASNEESLNFLRGLVGSSPKASVRERAALALALHDDARVPGLLKELVRSSQDKGVRSTAVFWLGQGGGETEYLASIVRDERENSDLRRSAAHAVGASRDRQALEVLQSLYGSVTNREVRRGIVHAVAENENKPAAHAFLLRVARSDADRDVRRAAVHQLAESGGEAAIDDLMGIYANDRDEDIRRQVIHALAEINSPRAQAKVLEIARSGDDPDLRRQAIHHIGERDTEQAVDQLTQIYEAERSGDVRRQILHAFSEMKSPRAQAKLLAVARDRQEHPDARRQAIHWLGERGDDAAVDELMRIFAAETSMDVRRQILHALAEMKNQRAEDKLFEIARGADHAELRRAAIHRLGEMASERSFELLRNTVNSSDEKTDVQVQAVRAISEKPPEQSVPLLINVARTHPNPEVRREAIRRLGESGDPRAVDFFKQLLSK
jgi:HEAT repeat protein